MCGCVRVFVCAGVRAHAPGHRPSFFRLSLTFATLSLCHLLCHNPCLVLSTDCDIITAYKRYKTGIRSRIPDISIHANGVVESRVVEGLLKKTTMLPVVVESKVMCKLCARSEYKVCKV